MRLEPQVAHNRSLKCNINFYEPLEFSNLRTLRTSEVRQPEWDSPWLGAMVGCFLANSKSEVHTCNGHLRITLDHPLSMIQYTLHR